MKTNCIFKEDTHQYFLVGDKGVVLKELISVTTLMRKHGLAPSYDGVPSEVLNRKAEYGKLVHKELENFIKRGEIGFSQELQDFIVWLQKSDFEAIDSEFVVHNDVVAGTVDLLAERRFAIDDIQCVLGDFKTTATLHRDAVAWQLSIYAYLYNKQFGVKIDNLQAFHFNDGLRVFDIDFKPVAEIERLFECERNGEIYQPQQLQLASDLEMQIIEAENTIKAIDLQLKEAQAQAEQLRQILIDKMREQRILSFENDNLKISYISPTTREAIDSVRLKKELPEIAEQYKKISNVKESVRITLKK